MYYNKMSIIVWILTETKEFCLSLVSEEVTTIVADKNTEDTISIGGKMLSVLLARHQGLRTESSVVHQCLEQGCRLIDK